MLDSQLELIDLGGAPLRSGGDLLDTGSTLSDSSYLGEDTVPFARYVAERGDELLRVSSAASLHRADAEPAVVAALATAYRQWRELTDSGADPHLEVLRLLCRRLPHDDIEDVETPPAAGTEADPADTVERRVLGRMMPRERLAAALTLVAGLGEHEVASAMRTPWLHAVAVLARSRSRGPELLANAGLRPDFVATLLGLADETGPAPVLAATARRAATRRTAGVVAAAVAGVVALSCTALAASAAGLGSAGAADTSPIISAGNRPDLMDPSMRTRCPEPLQVGPLRRTPKGILAGSTLLTRADLTHAGLGPQWRRDPTTRPQLPVPLVSGHNPIAPASQLIAARATLVADGGASRVDQVVIRYPTEVTSEVIGTAARLLMCTDDGHDVQVSPGFLFGSPGSGAVAVRRLAKPGVLSSSGSAYPTEYYDLFAHSGNLVTIVHMSGGRTTDLDRRALEKLSDTVLARLAGNTPATRARPSAAVSPPAVGGGVRVG